MDSVLKYTFLLTMRLWSVLFRRNYDEVYNSRSYKLGIMLKNNNWGGRLRLVDNYKVTRQNYLAKIYKWLALYEYVNIT